MLFKSFYARRYNRFSHALKRKKISLQYYIMYTNMFVQGWEWTTHKGIQWKPKRQMTLYPSLPHQNISSRLHSHAVLQRKHILFKICIKVLFIKRHPWGQVQNHIFWVSKRRKTMNAETTSAVTYCSVFPFMCYDDLASHSRIALAFFGRSNHTGWSDSDTWKTHFKLLRGGFCFLHKQNKHK